jgi:hypothetical protein
MSETAKPSVRAQELFKRIKGASKVCLCDALNAAIGTQGRRLCSRCVAIDAIEAFAHEERSRLREALEGLVAKWRAEATSRRESRGGWTLEYDAIRTRADELEALLPTPGAPEGSDPSGRELKFALQDPQDAPGEIIRSPAPGE